MNARMQLERFYGSPAPVITPQKPGIAPTTVPSRPPSTNPGRPNPWRRRDMKPGTDPRPKSRLHAEAVEFLKANGLAEFTVDRVNET